MQIYEITEGILKGVKAAPPTPVAAPSAKAGFAKNAAEYFANRVLNTAGVSQSQQGQYDPTGHMAASMGKGAAALKRQELEIANQLSREWLKKKTMNDSPIANLTQKDIAAAVDLANKSSYRDLSIDNDAVANQILKIISDSGRKAQSAGAPAPGSFSGWQSGPTASNKPPASSQYSEPIQVGPTVKDAYVKGPQGWVSAKNKYIPAPDNMIYLLDKALASQGSTK